MIGLPVSTEINKPLYKTKLYLKFGLTTAQQAKFDADISHLVIVNAVSPATVPALAAGDTVQAIYVIRVDLKTQQYDPKNIELISKLIPQKILFTLVKGDEVQLAIFYDILLTSQWQKESTVSPFSLYGLDLDQVWESVVRTIGKIDPQFGTTLSEQIAKNIERKGLLNKITTLETKCRNEKQPRKKFVLHQELIELRKQLS